MKHKTLPDDYWVSSNHIKRPPITLTNPLYSLLSLLHPALPPPQPNPPSQIALRLLHRIQPPIPNHPTPIIAPLLHQTPTPLLLPLTLRPRPLFLLTSCLFLELRNYPSICSLTLLRLFVAIVIDIGIAKVIQRIIQRIPLRPLFLLRGLNTDDSAGGRITYDFYGVVACCLGRFGGGYCEC